MHLETIIKDLRERFARIELQVSPPLVAFRESVFHQAELPEAISKPPKVCTRRSRRIASAADQMSTVIQPAMESPRNLQSEANSTHTASILDTACAGPAGTCRILREKA